MFTYIRGDTKDIDTLIDFSPDLVYHLGEYSRVEQSFDDNKEGREYNKYGTLAVLEFVRKHGSKIVYAGIFYKFGDGGLGRTAQSLCLDKASSSS